VGRIPLLLDLRGKSKSFAELSKVPRKIKIFDGRFETSKENPELPSKIQIFRRTPGIFDGRFQTSIEQSNFPLNF
jgi:hypothetical protein